MLRGAAAAVVALCFCGSTQTCHLQFNQTPTKSTTAWILAEWRWHLLFVRTTAWNSCLISDHVYLLMRWQCSYLQCKRILRIFKGKKGSSLHWNSHTQYKGWPNFLAVVVILQKLTLDWESKNSENTQPNWEHRSQFAVAAALKSLYPKVQDPAYHFLLASPAFSCCSLITLRDLLILHGEYLK